MSDAQSLFLTILTPERRLVESQPISEVTLTGVEGLVQILPGHAAFISQLSTGFFEVTPVNKGETSWRGVISTGFIEVTPREAGTEVVVAAETLELGDEIDLDRARQAQRKAEEALSAAGLEESHFEKYQLKLQRALIRQQVASAGSR